MKVTIDAYVLVWDWKDMAPIGEIMDAIGEFKDKYGEVDWHDIETNADEYAIVIAPHSLSADYAKFIYENRYELQKDIHD